MTDDDCNCEFEPDPDDSDDDFHYRRVCDFCGGVWWSLHCPHDGHQRPCPHCHAIPRVRSVSAPDA